LAKSGDEVHVWAPGREGTRSIDEGVNVHRLRDAFTVKGIAELDRGLAAERSPKRLLVQYVPQSFGYKAMNMAFVAWLAARRDSLWVMFHEVATPWYSRQAKHLLLGAVTRLDAAVLAKRAEKLFVSVPAWERLLRSFVPGKVDAEWSPVPSNMPPDADRSLADDYVRAKLEDDSSAVWVGHFGTYGETITMRLGPSLTMILEADAKRFGVLLGRGSERFAETLPARLRPRVHALGERKAGEIAAALSLCDLVVQPYPDGISSRRGSIMAPVALGRPVLTHEGAQTETVWNEERAVVLAKDDSASAYLTAANAVLAEPALAAAVAKRAQALYEKKFSIERTIERLKAAAAREDVS
ncbi:MAG TPA: hypothetical protein VF407_25320, partial [Polyangiaceae bacterium]